MADELIIRKALRALRLGRALRLVSNASPSAFVASAGLWVALYVLEGGRLTEEGCHEDLAARGGTYAHLDGLQARLCE